MAKYITGALDKLKVTFDILKQNGGIRGSLYQLFRTDELKNGTVVGTDKYGNTYYENNRYFVVFLDYDGSQVPAEWYGWLHYKTDLPPTVKPSVKYKWMVDHTENKSGTSEAYMPFSTTKSKIQAWDPNARKE
ncbi:hypothetical protein GHT06_012903 [Daphnia sinensis]|uniref:NADH dehydrogenase [ubiquinone] 1 alpha subcomplex subunit 12 n=1 Tax=Daphnia sinensis TaxID=1820382 RepID=A0AAD5LFU4_9CRUS|nr:hypothetical protein GHT06_012903 [Daphnia sinensis]